MTQSIKLLIATLLVVWSTGFSAYGQTEQGDEPTAISFSSIDQLLAYTSTSSLILDNNQIRLTQAQKGKLAAILGTIDVTGNLLSAQFTNNTTLGITPFPAEIFGGEPGTFREVQTGVQYNTNLTNYADVKLVNVAGWTNLKLANINIDLTTTNNLVSLKNYQESLSASYYNIVNLQEQIASTRQNLTVADTLYQIALRKFEEGLVNKQDVNDSRVNVLNTEENIRQLEYLLDQYYLSLQTLCDLPADQDLVIRHEPMLEPAIEEPVIMFNDLTYKSALLQESYAQTAYQNAKSAYLPTLSLQLSNSYNLYNTELQPFSGNWINSNYIGLRLNVPIPSAQRISQTSNARFEYEMAINNKKQAELSAQMDHETLLSDYEKALSQLNTNREILALNRDSFQKNQNLYEEGLIGLEVVLGSYNSMVSTEYNLISSEVNLQLVQSSIDINNNIH